MANAGGAWDNAKKIVEVELKEKGTDAPCRDCRWRHSGDPFKDTSSVSMNPVIKFTTLFGLLAVELAITLDPRRCAYAGSPVLPRFHRLCLAFVLRHADH